MQMHETVARARPDGMDPQEWEARLELAACYRLFDFLGWTEMIFNHLTLRLPGEEPLFLINPYGLHYAEVTATNLVKIDVQGRKVDDSPWPVNPAGFVIHSAIHAARHDAHCVMHTHTTAGVAVACKKEGLSHDNFYGAQFFGQIAYHDFEGVTTDPDEQQRLLASLGDRSVLILRSHGLLVAGAHVPDTFYTMWSLQRACEVQLAAASMPGPNWPVPESVLRAIPGQRARMNVGSERRGQRMFDGICRRAGIRYEDLI